MSNKPEAKTYEEHLNYLNEMVRLKLVFLWYWLRQHSEETFEDVIEKRVDIVRKTEFNHANQNPTAEQLDNKHPRWLQMVEDCKACFLSCRDDADPDRFENRGFEVFRATIEKRARPDFEYRPYVLDYQCGSLKYDEPTEEEPDTVGFHIANALAPRSIFEDPEYLPNCFLDLMKQTEDAYKATRLGTFTWLNSYPAWLKLFPREWIDNLEPEDKMVRWHYGYWGQFINAKGAFNKRMGDKFRENRGELPYYPRRSSCAFSAMRDHLNKNFLNQIEKQL